MDRTRDLAQGLSRIENQVAKPKYKTIRVIPTIAAVEVEDGEVLFAPTEIPKACLPNGVSILKQIKVFDLADIKVDIDLIFTETAPTVEALTGVAAAKFNIVGGDSSDAIVQAANPLGAVILDVNGSNTTAFDYSDNAVYIQNSVDMFVTSKTGSVHVMGVATATKNYAAATNLIFDFIFEEAR